MKVFNETKYGERINFVDENNVFIGFDYFQSCCEDFGYAITKTCPKTFKEIETLEEIPDDSISEYVFDTSFEHFPTGSDSWNEENCATFRAVDKNLNEIFITIWNAHNGYYSHGYEFKNGENLIREGSL